MTDNDSILLSEAYQQILEQDITRTGPKTVDSEDVSDFIYKITNGGKELFTVHTIRKTDSTQEYSKRAGDTMRITGKYGACSASTRNVKYKRPDLSSPTQYRKNSVIRMCVSSVDGKDYTSKFPPKNRTRSFDVTNILKIEAGGQTYDVI